MYCIDIGLYIIFQKGIDIKFWGRAQNMLKEHPILRLIIDKKPVTAHNCMANMKK